MRYKIYYFGGQGGCRAHYVQKDNGVTVRRVCRFATYPYKYFYTLSQSTRDF